MKLVVLIIPLVVAFYTTLYGMEIWREKNYSGSIAVMVLGTIVAGLPIYILFF